ncbi:MAG: 50S ribosomal protein L23 [Planctomycetota bacterium]
MKLTVYDVLRAPRLSEKTVYQRDLHGAYVFEVHPKANKVQIREAVATVYGVKVAKVATANRHHKFRRSRGGMMEKRPPMKIATVTLAEGETIEGV